MSRLLERLALRAIAAPAVTPSATPFAHGRREPAFDALVVDLTAALPRPATTRAPAILVDAPPTAVPAPTPRGATPPHVAAAARRAGRRVPPPPVAATDRAAIDACDDACASAPPAAFDGLLGRRTVTAPRSAPVVRMTIGRVEIRAQTAPPSPPRALPVPAHDD